MPTAVDGGERGNFSEGVAVSRKPTFKRGAASHEGQHVVGQSLRRNQRVDKFCGRAFGSQQHRVKKSELAIVERAINLPVEIFNRGEGHAVDDAFNSRAAVGEHVIIVRGKVTVDIERSRHVQRVNQIKNLHGVIEREKAFRRVSQYRLKRQGTVNQLERVQFAEAQ